ncbi:MAG: threonine synthase [Nitrososphaerales archaeon]
MSYILSLKCRECGREYEPLKLAVCSNCFAPLDVTYDLKNLKLRRESFNDRERNLWRYRELLPLKEDKYIVNLGAGYTPLIKGERIEEKLNFNHIYIKNDSVNPTFSFKDRPAGIAVSKALELGDKVVGCASTGNLAGSVAAHAAKANVPCYVLVPFNIEPAKISQIIAYGARILALKGNYDDANRLAVLAAEELGWNIVNVTSRPYYVEGSKTIAFEVCEQLNWELPDHIIIPVASGALLCSIYRGFKQFMDLDLVKGTMPTLHGAQALGCSPVAQAFKEGRNFIIPIENPNTIATSIAIGDPGDGIYVNRIVRETGGIVEAISDEEIVNSIKLLASTEGIFSEPAGGVVIGTLKKLIEEGKVKKGERVVCCITGNGLKASELISEKRGNWYVIEPNLNSLKNIVLGLGNGKG